MTAIFKRFKQFCPLTNLTEFLCARTFVQNFVKIDLYDQEIKQLTNLEQFLEKSENTGKASWAVINVERNLRKSPSEERMASLEKKASTKVTQ